MYHLRTARSLAITYAASSRGSLSLLRHGYRTWHASSASSSSLPRLEALWTSGPLTTTALSTAICFYSTTPARAEAALQGSGRKVGSRPDLPEITLYQFEVCPFCNKVRAYLDFHNVPYRVVEVDPLRKKELEFSEDYRKVPIALINGKQVNGSREIIAAVDGVIRADAVEAERDADESKWAKWTDDHLIHLISPNIYRTAHESVQAFSYITDNAKFSPIQRFAIRYTGAAAMYFVARKIKRKYNIKDERRELYDALDKWITAVNEHGGRYLGGEQGPNIADLSVYGVIKAIEKFDTFQDVRQNSQGFSKWFDNMKSVVGETCITERL